MSIRVMSAVFDIEDMGPTQRLILLALADHADDQGRCYPSIARLCRRTGLKERSIQTNLKALVEAGFLRIEKRAGPKGCNVFFVLATPAADAPRSKCTPASNAPHPRSKCTPTPAADAPEPSVTIKETSVPPISPTDILAEVASLEIASQFVEHRRQMKKPLTELAARKMVNRLSQHPSPDAVLDYSMENGWQGIFPENVKGETNEAVNEASRAADIWRQQQQSRGMDIRQDSRSVVPLLPARSAAGGD